MLPALAPTTLIVGCGYLGRVVARRLITQGVLVYGTTRGPARAAEVAALGVRPLMLTVTQPVTLAALRPALEADELDVFYLVPPGRSGGHPTPRQTVLGGVAHLIKQLRRANVRRAVLASSTGVYGQAGGERVDADTPAEPRDERARLLLEGERLWLDAGPTYHVVRFAGIYGPRRIVGESAVRQGAPLVGDPQALLNLIHVDDAAALLEAVATAETPGSVELGSDGHPVPRIDYYSHLARLLGVPAPAVLGPEEAARTLGVSAARLARASSKACDNIPTCRRTGWSPRYPTYRAGLEAAMRGSESEA